MTLKVPLIGTNVVPEGEGSSAPINGATLPPVQPMDTPAQPAQRQSLHRVRMTRPQVEQPEVRGEFDSFGRVKWVPVEKTQEQAAQADKTADVEDSSPDAGGGAQAGGFDVPPHPDAQVPPPTAQTFEGLQRQIGELTQTVNLLAQVSLKGALPQQPAKPQAPTPPDPTQFDFYDAASTAEFHRLNNAYIQATVRHEVNAALEPHGASLQDAQLNSQYNAVVFQHGQDANFKPNMESALRLVAAFPNISIPDAYKHVASTQATSSPRQSAATTPQPVAKPAQRTMTREEAAQKAAQAKSLPASQGVSGTAELALPASLRNVGALGRIMLHNQQSGRATPV